MIDALDDAAHRSTIQSKREACWATARFLAELADIARKDLHNVDPLPEYHYDNEGHAIHDA